MSEMNRDSIPPPLVFWCYQCSRSWRPPQDIRWQKSPTGEGGTWVSTVELEDTYCDRCGYKGRGMRSVEDLDVGKGAEDVNEPMSE